MTDELAGRRLRRRLLLLAALLAVDLLCAGAVYVARPAYGVYQAASLMVSMWHESFVYSATCEASYATMRAAGTSTSEVMGTPSSVSPDAIGLSESGP